MRHIAMVATSALLLAGCAATPLEADYGKSVTQIAAAQAADPRTLSNPSTAVIEGADPDQVNLAVQSLRADKGSRGEVSRNLTINVAGQAGGQ